MLLGDDAFRCVTINFILMVLWQFLVLIVCQRLSERTFDYRKNIYKLKKFENNGKFYVKYLKIKKWKDKLPQYVSKNGFSKRNINLKNVCDKKYFEKFLIETCRAEWNHLVCCMYAVISMLINKFPFSMIFSIIPVMANLPFLVIQRYNRIRFLNLNSKKSVL
ncbi:MAG: hypothetical protein Q4B84_05215 [Clostridia bacterium]|nr:hypothetical protein [Clostridia bacterium]